MLKVWGRRSAFNVQKVLWLIDELGLQHTHIDAGGTFGGLDTPEFLALNPHGRVPVIDDDGTIVWESHSILRYLAARYGAGSWWPEAAAQRSHADRWSDWSLATLQRDFMDLFWHFYRTPEAQRDAALIASLAQRTAAHFELLDRHLARQPWLAGEHISFGDIPAGTALYRYFEIDVAHPEVPHVRDWYARLGGRPPYRRHVMRPFAELRGQLAY